MLGAEAFLGWLGATTLVGGGLTAVVWGLRRVSRRSVPPGVLVVLWVVVFLRLLLPAVPEVPRPEVPAWGTPVFALPGSRAATSTATPTIETSVASVAEVPTKERASGSATIEVVLFGLWGVGFLAVATAFGGGTMVLGRKLRNRTPLDQPRLHALVDECRATMGVRRTVGLFTVPGLETPAITGLLRPKILVPPGLGDHLSDADWRHVLCHELAHLRRGDLVLQCLAGWAVAVHWFNPLAWMAWFAFRTDTELACDRAVLDRLPANDRPAYGHTLLQLASRRPLWLSWTPALAPWGTPKRDWKRRILMIATHRIDPWWKKPLLGALVLLFGVVGLTQAQPARVAGPETLVSLTVTPTGKPRQSFSMSPTGFLKSKLYELSVGGAHGLSLNGHPLTAQSVLADRGGIVVLDGQDLAPPWVLRGWGEGESLKQGQAVAQGTNDGIADAAGLASSFTLDPTLGQVPPPVAPLPLGVYQPAELSFGQPEPRAPRVAGRPVWIAVKDSSTVAQAVASTVAEAQTLAPWALEVPQRLPAGYAQDAEIALFKDKWGHVFSSVGFRSPQAPEGARLLLLETDRAGWRPRTEGPGRLTTTVGTVTGHWNWAWSELGSIGDRMVAVRATELAWTKDGRSFLLVDSTGLSRAALVEVAASIR